MNKIKKLDKKLVAKNVAKLILESNLSHEEIAEELNVSTRLIYCWQKGERLPNTQNVYSISQLFNVSMESILS